MFDSEVATSLDMFETDEDYVFDDEEFEDSTCTICLKSNFCDLVEPVRTSCNHVFCWYAIILRNKTFFIFVLSPGPVYLVMLRLPKNINVRTAGF